MTTTRNTPDTDWRRTTPKMLSPRTYEHQIYELRDDAALHGDAEQVKICNRALRGSQRALAECERVLDAAASMDDGAPYEEWDL